jgi:chemotaxis protein MotB
MKPLIESPEQDLQVWPPYVDVAFNIILILLVLLFAQVVISSQTSAALLTIAERQAALRTDLLESVPAGMRQNLVITQDGNLLRITFSDRVLFDPAQADLKVAGRELLGTTGEVLKRHLPMFNQIQIEGHTDDRPINSQRFPSNWELSSARATSVVRFLQDEAGIDAPRLSATGYAEFHPAASGASEDARARNRRIELVIVYSTLNVVA